MSSHSLVMSLAARPAKARSSADQNGRGEVVAVWDIDSDRWDDFSPSEVEALERLAQVVSAQWDAWTWEIE